MTLIVQGAPPAWFPDARAPAGSLTGLLLRSGCWEEAHAAAQADESPDGSYWHAIIHRMEPDSANAGYWFGQVGQHPVFPGLYDDARRILAANPGVPWTLGKVWDPFRFLQWCDEVKSNADSARYETAMAIQQAEWERLFVWCAFPI